MKLSELQHICETAIQKYGDLEVGFCESERSSEIEIIKDCSWTSVKARFITEYCLPGVPILEEEEEDINTTPFVVLFMNDDRVNEFLDTQ